MKSKISNCVSNCDLSRSLDSTCGQQLNFNSDTKTSYFFNNRETLEYLEQLHRLKQPIKSGVILNRCRNN